MPKLDKAGRACIWNSQRNTTTYGFFVKPQTRRAPRDIIIPLNKRAGFYCSAHLFEPTRFL